MISPEQAKLEKALRNAENNFWSFCLFMQPDFFSSRETPLMELANALNTAWYSDEERYTLAISTPPRTGKSTLMNYFCAWSIGKDFNRSIIRASYNQDLSDELSGNMKEIMDTERYQMIFKLPRRTVDSKSKLKLKGGHRMTYTATSVGGSATGYGCSIIITDDPYKDHVEALSPSTNKRTISWYKSALQSRLDTKNQIEIVVGTRWTPNELVAKMEESNYFNETYKIRALTEDNKSFNENIISTNALLKLKELDENGLFNAMYQQEPLEVTNGLFQIEQLQFIDSKPYEVLSRIALIDPKTTGTDDFVIIIGSIAYIDGIKRVFIEDILCDSSPLDDELENRIVQFLYYYNPELTFMESNVNISFANILQKRLKGIKINTFRTTKNKESKIIEYSKYIRRMVFQNLGQDKEYDNAIKQLCRYDLDKPRQKDDVPDTLSMLAIHLILYGNKIQFSEWKKEVRGANNEFNE